MKSKGSGRRGVVWVGVLALALAAGCRRQDMEVKAGSGEGIYTARCAVCHGEHGEGREGLYPALARSAWVDGPPERMAAIILDGMTGPLEGYNAVMPGWRNYMRDAEIAEVMTWLRHADGKTPVSPVEVSHARMETAERNTFWTVKELQGYRMR
jgi:mono/diheme cytochrome c family protein